MSGFELNGRMEQTLPRIDDEHAINVCKVGQREACCRYLSLAEGGWSCQKLTGSMRELIDRRFAEGRTKSKGDNCDGRAE